MLNAQCLHVCVTCICLASVPQETIRNERERCFLLLCCTLWVPNAISFIIHSSWILC